MSVKKIRLFSFFLIVILGTNFFVPAVTAENETKTNDSRQDALNHQNIILSLNFVPPKIEKSRECDLISIADLPNSCDSGMPSLPFKTVKILLPQNKTFLDIVITTGNKIKLDGSFYIDWGKEPVPLSGDISLEKNGVYSKFKYSHINERNLTTYNSVEPYPGKLYSIIGISQFRGYNFLAVNLYPVQYIPKTGEIYYYEKFEITVNTVTMKNQFEESLFRGLPQDEARISEIVDNPEMVTSYKVASKQSGHLYDYVIITNNALNASTGMYTFQDLASFKNSKGVNTTIVTVEDIINNSAYWNSTPVFNDTQAKIRNFITDAYLKWGIEYVLLGGDGDGADVGGESGDNIIPARGFYCYVDGETDTNIPADIYYGCLDGNFNYDQDTNWAEPTDGINGGEVDLFAEVYVGRAPVDSAEELSNFVMKTLSYEISMDPYLHTAWMVAEYLGFGGVADYGSSYKEEIRNGSSAHGYTTAGIPSAYNTSTLYDSPTYSWPESEIIGVINNNTHIINHLGHANVNYVMKIENTDVDTYLTNQKYFFGYSQGCYAGAFDNRDVYGDYTTYDCICEHFIGTQHGAFAFIANSRYGWGAFESTDGPSQRFDREFFDALFNESIRQLGKANQDSKEDNIGYINNASYGGTIRWCYYQLNLFGDPTTRIKDPIKPEHDIIVSNINVPTYGLPNENISISANIYNNGQYTENITVDLVVNNVTLSSIPVLNITSEYSRIVELNWLPTSYGIYNVTVYAELIPNENVTTNNAQTASVIIGPDIAVLNVTVPAYLEVLTSGTINATIANLGKTNETNVTVNLTINGIVVNTSSISLQTGSMCSVTFVWNACTEGQYDISIYAVPLANETYIENNNKNVVLWVGYVVFSDDIESGVGTWTEAHSSTAIPPVKWDITTARSHSATHAWRYSDGTDYDDGLWNYGNLTSGEIDLEDVTSALLVFWRWYETEDGTYYDQKWIKISVNGSAFQNLFQIFDTPSAWVQETINLTPYAGSRIRIRFHFDAIDSILNDYEGWYIDDAKILGVPRIKYQHDIAVSSIQIPTPVELNKTTYVNASIRNIGLNNESNVQVNFTVDGIVVNATAFSIIYSGETKFANFSWTPNVTGDHTIGIYAVPVPNENVTTNNLIEKTVTVIAYPDIWIMPAQFNLTITRGDTYNTTLVIGNDGLSMLNFNISTRLGSMLHPRNALSTIITDPNEGATIDIKCVKAGITGNNISFEVETYTTTAYDEIGYLWLDTDQDSSTGWTENDIPGYGLNDIGADYFMFIYVGYGSGDVYDYYFNYMGSVSIIAGTYDFNFTIPLSYLGNDEGIMDVTLCLGDYYSPTDIAPDTGHGTTGVSTAWLSISPRTGTVDIGNQTNITVSVNATALDVGMYNGTIVITSNDPDESPLNTPVCLRVASSQHDIAVSSIQIPTPIELNKTTYVNATIKNIGLNNENNVQVNFTVNDIIVNTTTFSIIYSGETKFANFSWTPNVTGEQIIGIYVVPVPSENVTTNNLIENTVTVIAYPDIWVTPAEINITVTQGMMYNDTVIIGNNGTAPLYFNITAQSGGNVTLFSDNMENGTNGWTHSGTYDEWELGTPTYGPSSAHSGTKCWGTDLDNTYSNSCNQSLQSPSINISGMQYVNLSFWSWSYTESSFDYCYVEISRDGGSWNTIASWSGSYQSWTKKTYNISSLCAGYSTVKIRFRLTSDSSVIYAGWYIDDAELIGYGSVACNWLSATPSNDTVNVDTQTNITVSVNTTGLDVGMYNGTIVITSNDPDESIISIPVHLTVRSAEHDVAVVNIVSPSTTEVTKLTYINATIKNLGINDDSDLEVWLLVDGETENSTSIPFIESGKTQYVNFTWIPLSIDNYTVGVYLVPFTGENITNNNLVEIIVSVVGYPDIWIDPTEFDINITYGTILNETLVIGNNGTGSLIFNITAGSRMVYLSNNSEAIYIGIEYIESNLDPYFPSIDDVVALIEAQLAGYTVNQDLIWTCLNTINNDSCIFSSAPPLEAYMVAKEAGYPIPDSWIDAEMPWMYSWIAYNDIYYTSIGLIGVLLVQKAGYDVDTAICAQGIEFLETNQVDGGWGFSQYDYQALRSLLLAQENSYTVDASVIQAGLDNRDGLGMGDLIVFKEAEKLGYLIDPAKVSAGEDYWVSKPEYAYAVRNLVALEREEPPTWLSVEPASGTVEIGNQVGITLTINATELDNGTYNVSIILTSNDPDETKITMTVHLTVVPNQLPVAIIEDGDRYVNEGEIVILSGINSYDIDGVIINYTWDFGDGNISYGINVSHIYLIYGVYNVILTVKDDWNAIGQDIITVYVNALPRVNVSITPTEVYTYENVTFNVTAYDIDGKIVLYEWDFNGDGFFDWYSTINGNTSFKYYQCGSYNATIKVTDNNLTFSTKCILITVNNRLPTANFTFLLISPTTADIIYFADTSTDSDGTVVNWGWDFGDGSTSTSQNPTHQYLVPENYTVNLTIADDDGASDSYSCVVSVSSVNQSPTANFTYSPSSPEVNENIQFNDISYDPDGTISAWYWEFGDGNVSSVQNPVHAYSLPSTYTVKLTVTDNNGTNSTCTKEITTIAPDTTVQAAPTDLTATPGNGAVDLSWNANTESDLVGYNIYRSVTSGSGYVKINTALVTGTSYHDTGLTNGVTYYYVVTAADNAGNPSGYSNEVLAKPEKPTEGGKPGLIPSVGIAGTGLALLAAALIIYKKRQMYPS